MVIDLVSKDSVTYRQYTDSIKKSFCGREGSWYENDSVIYGTCDPNAKIIKFLNDTMVFRYTIVSFYIDYNWKKVNYAFVLNGFHIFIKSNPSNNIGCLIPIARK